MDNRVFLKKVDVYDTDAIYEAVKDAFSSLGIGKDDFFGKKVVIKPNLIMKYPPENAATTHPTVVRAVVRLLSEYGVRPVVTESPGGPYSSSRLAAIYRTCGMDTAADGLADLNYDTSTVSVTCPDGKVLHSFNILKPIADADVILDLAKLKSHSLTKMTGAVKNLFGTVPGIEKFEMHARFPDEKSFAAAITDICSYFCENKRVIAITDAVMSMEGNGPTGGRPKKVGYILVSNNPAASDAAGAELIGFDGITIDETAAARGMYGGRESLELLGDGLDPVADFAAPDSKKRGKVKLLTLLSEKRIGRYFRPRPAINAKKCVGCGECARSCPQHTIRMEKVKGKLRAIIDSKKCIRCFCCQELCPHVAIKTVRNPFISVFDARK